MAIAVRAGAARPPLVLALGIAAALALGACSSAGGTQPPTTQAPAATPSAATSEGPASPGTSPQASPSEAPAATAVGSPTNAACVVAAEGTTGTALDIRGFQFPDAATVPSGGSITWSNRDAVPHSVTFDDDPCTSGTIAGGGAVTVTYTVPGSYAFHCRFHPSMKGTLEVTG